MTRYLERLFAGEAPSVSDWNEHLVEFHRHFTDATSGPLTILRTSEGLTSYEALAGAVRDIAPNAQSVLDVGCGDGILLERMAQSFPHDVALAGVDLCDAEIERAAVRNPRARLLCADVATFAPEQEFDVVVSHLVFGILPNLRSVLARLRDMLTSNGVLVFAIEDELERAMPARLLAQCVGIVRERYPAYAPRIPERDIVDDDAHLLTLLSECGYSTARVEKRVLVEAAIEPERVWEFVLRAYPVGLLDYATLEDLRERIEAAARDWSSGGRLRIDYPTKIIVAHK